MDNRDIEHLNHLYQMLIKMKVKYPHLRIGQILYCAMKVNQDIFYIEDDELAKAVERFYEDNSTKR